MLSSLAQSFYSEGNEAAGLLVILGFWVVVGGSVGYALGKGKDRGADGLWLGVFLGVIGWIIVAVMQPSAAEERRRRAQAAADAAAVVAAVQAQGQFARGAIQVQPTLEVLDRQIAERVGEVRRLRALEGEQLKAECGIDEQIPRRLWLWVALAAVVLGLVGGIVGFTADITNADGVVVTHQPDETALGVVIGLAIPLVAGGALTLNAYWARSGRTARNLACRNLSTELQRLRRERAEVEKSLPVTLPPVFVPPGQPHLQQCEVCGGWIESPKLESHMVNHRLDAMGAPDR